MLNAGESETALQKAVITMRDLSKVYRSATIEYPALRGIDLTINEGEFVSIMGPSGSGKTTLMNIIGLLDNLTGGYYELKGIDSSDLGDGSRASLRNRTIGFIFQSFNLLPQMNLIDIGVRMHSAGAVLHTDGAEGSAVIAERVAQARERSCRRWSRHGVGDRKSVV